MADNSSGFVDFSTYSDLNADEEQRLMDEAYARAQAADEKARSQLTRAYQDTQGMNSDVDALSKSASYGDYLKAADEAKKAWSTIFKDGADPRGSALRGNLRAKMGAGDLRAASMTDLAGRETELGKRVGENFAGAQQNRAEQAAYKQRVADEETERKRAWEEHLKQYKGQLWTKYQQTNSGSNSKYTNEDQAKYARYVQQMGGIPPEHLNKPYSAGLQSRVAGDAWGVDIKDQNGNSQFSDPYQFLGSGRMQTPGQAKSQHQQQVESNPWFDDEEG